MVKAVDGGGGCMTDEHRNEMVKAVDGGGGV